MHYKAHFWDMPDVDVLMPVQDKEAVDPLGLCETMLKN